MKEETTERTGKPMLAQLREMSVGDVLVFPIERASTIKSCCSAFGLEWNKVFRTKQDRINRTLSVTRLS